MPTLVTNDRQMADWRLASLPREVGLPTRVVDPITCLLNQFLQIAIWSQTIPGRVGVLKYAISEPAAEHICLNRLMAAIVTTSLVSPLLILKRHLPVVARVDSVGHDEALFARRRATVLGARGVYHIGETCAGSSRLTNS